MHYSINPVKIKTENKKLRLMVTDIWNIKEYWPKLPLSVFFVGLKPALNNKDIFNVEYMLQRKIKFEPPEHERHIAQCANCLRYEHTKNYCYLKLGCVKCAGNTSQTSATKDKDIMSGVSSVVENVLYITRDSRSRKSYKNAYLPLQLKKIHSSHTNQTYPTYSTI